LKILTLDAVRTTGREGFEGVTADPPSFIGRTQNQDTDSKLNLVWIDLARLPRILRSRER